MVSRFFFLFNITLRRLAPWREKPFSKGLEKASLTRCKTIFSHLKKSFSFIVEMLIVLDQFSLTVNQSLGILRKPI